MIVLIDDERDFKQSIAPEGVIVLRTSAEAINWLRTLTPEDNICQLWLDHDLGLLEDGVTPDTIEPVVKELESMFFHNTSPNIEQVLVHTANPVGGDNIFKSMSKIHNTVRVSAGDYTEVRG